MKPFLRRLIAGVTALVAALLLAPTASADYWPASSCQQFYAAYGYYPAGACDSFNGNLTTTTTVRVTTTTTIPATTTTTALPPQECSGRADGVTGGVECP